MTGTWQRRADTLWRERLGEVVLLAAGGEEPFALGEPGSTVWALLADPCTIDELAAAFTGDAGDVRAGLESLLADLEARGVVSRRPPR